MAFPTDLVRFKASEFEYPDQMNVSFVRWLDKVAQRAGKEVPFVITDDARKPGEAPPGAAKNSMHFLGQAVDIRSKFWTSIQKWKALSAIMALADEAPFKICLEQVYSDTDRHWHLDVKAERVFHLLVEADE